MFLIFGEIKYFLYIFLNLMLKDELVFNRGISGSKSIDLFIVMLERFRGNVKWFIIGDERVISRRMRFREVERC